VIGTRARCLARAGFLRFREAEVRELGVATLGDQDVVGLDVAMEDARLVRRGERVRDAGQQLDASRVVPPASSF